MIRDYDILSIEFRQPGYDTQYTTLLVAKGYDDDYPFQVINKELLENKFKKGELFFQYTFIGSAVITTQDEADDLEYTFIAV